MSEMVLLKCEIGSKAAIVACPKCGRISRQILKNPFYMSKASFEFVRPHTCPVCEMEYNTGNSKYAEKWSKLFDYYNTNADQYNQSVRDSYAKKINSTTSAPDNSFSSNPIENRINAGNGEYKEASTPSAFRVKSENEPLHKSYVPGSDFISSGQPQSVTSSEELDRKIDYWKRELLDTGKRNRMINYRETKRSTLKILEPEASELFNRLALSEKPLTFQKPINKDTDLRTYSIIALMETLSYTLNVQVGDIKTAGTIIEREKTLKNLRSKAKLAQEEQGTNILYLCFGFIYWREQNRDSSPWFKAPLLMMPVTLGIKSLNAPYTLSRYDDEIEVNPTLDYLFNTEYNIDLPKFELKNKDSFDDYIHQIEAIVDKRGWKVVKEVSLGLLSFLKISMYHDLNNNHERMINHPVLKAMAGDRTALGDIPVSAEHFNFDAVKPDECHEVVDSDSSQEEAVLLSKNGVSFVMQGPPGTGKSQTITNIIAEALADGKKVLFVSEKAAALEVVLKRLTEVQLDDFCLSLHNYKANKKEIIDSIGANLNLQPEYIDRAALTELTTLFEDRAFLTKYANELHQVIEPLGESIYSVFGKISKLEKASVVLFKYKNPKSVSKEQYLSLLYVLDALEKALHNLSEPLNANPWCNTTVKSSGQTFKQQMIQDTGLLPEKLRDLENKIRAFNTDYQAVIGDSWDSLGKSITDINNALELPLFPFWWTDTAKMETLISNVRREADEHHSLDAPMQKNRTTFYDSVLEAPLDDWVKRVKAILDSYRAIGYKKEDIGDDYLSAALHSAEETKELLSGLEVLSAQYKSVASELGLSEIDSIRNARKANEVLEILSCRPSFHENVWFFAANNEAALDLIGEADARASSLKRFSGAINSVWSENVRNLDLSDIGATFFEQYTWMYADVAETGCIEDQLSVYQRSAKDLFDKVSLLVDAHSKAIDVLGVKRADSLEGLRSISTLLKQASDVPYLETDWFDVRKNGAAQSLLEEALTHYTTITEQTDSILKKWEPEALNMEEEALAMLGRFKTEHVGAFHRMKAGYKDDIKKIRLLSKEVGKSIDESEAIAFLQSLKEIRDEKQWYKENEYLLKALAGSYYRGANTNWETVRQGMIIAADIANSFPYANIPEDVITAIQRSGSSIQSAAEIKELAAILSEEELADCEALLKAVRYVDQSSIDTSFRGLVLPQIQKFQELCTTQENHIINLQEQHLASSKITGKELSDLIANERELQQEEKWFRENSERLDSLFASKNHGADSDFEEIGRGLIYAKNVIGFFSDRIPDALIAMLCKDETPKVSAPAVDQLAPDVVNGLFEKLQSAAPYSGGEIESLSGSVIPRIIAWSAATRELATLDTEIKPYCVSVNLSPEQYLNALSTAVQIRNLRNQILDKELGLAKQLGDRYQGIDTDWAKIENDIQQVKRYISSFKPAVTRRFIEIICNSGDLRSEVRTAIREIESICDEAREPYQTFSSYFDEAEKIGSAEFGILANRYAKCLNGFDELNKWLDYVEARAECDAKGLGSFTAAIVQRNNSVEDVKNAFERGFYMQWLSAVIDDIPAVRAFRRSVHEQRLDRFRSLDTKQYKIARKRIREKIIRSFPSTDGMMKAGSELHILMHEMEKKKRIMPLRRLFQSIPNLLLTLKPCLMMSPLSVAYFLDANSYKFDMVIFDEASQIFPQDAIGAIFRAKQVIIAGDTKQLPPTNFFAASTGNSSEGYDNDEGYDDEVYDSILEETTNVLPNRTLLWHYRSKHEHLIAFSNQEIYRNNLVTFPSSNESEHDTGVEFVYVEDGYYEPTPKNYNTLEAARCVQLVKEHVDKHPDRSLGIIAFSEKQQQAIALEIQRFREKNPEYENFFVEGKEDEFFVKNLENVQGDERDTIFFSIGYAKTKEQKANGKPMSMRFGPLGSQGGERRLNVAITRAKINVKLISSILPSDIDLNRTESEGVRMLRSYIEFAMNGDATLSAAHKVNKPDDFVDAVAQFIRDHGFKVRQYIGCSGYKIDIAVQHPSEMVEQFVAGIECDGFSYVSAKTARDRDRLRNTVLKNMGWNLYRVWSAEWHKNPEIEGKKLLRFIEKAISDCDEKVKSIEEEKRRIEEAKRIELEKARAAKEAEERRKQREREEQEEKRRIAKAKQLELEKARAAKETEERRKQREREEQEEKRRIAKAKQLELEEIIAAREAEESRKQREREEQEEKRRALEAAERKKREEEEKKAAKLRAEQEAEISSEEAIRIAKENLRKAAEEQERRKARDLSWVQIHARVYHKSYGNGIVTSFSRDMVTVRFGTSDHTFGYPSAFLNGVLVKRDAPSLFTPKPSPVSGSEWAKVGTEVVHKTFGDGVVVKLEGSQLRVKFGEIVKTFVYPDAFVNGFLSRKDNRSVQSAPEFKPAQAETPRARQDLKQRALNNNSDDLLNELISAGFTVTDNRESSSIIWVFYIGGKKETFERIISKYNFKYSFERRGAIATYNVPAWRIMLD